MSIKVYDWIQRYADRHPDRKACIELQSGRSFTYQQFNESAARLAFFLLRAMNIVKGDRIAVLAQNSIDTLILQVACVKTGAIMLPLNWRLTIPELAYQIENASPKVLIHGPEYADVAQRIARDKDITQVIETNGDGSDSMFERAIANGPAELPAVELFHSDPWSIMYTSGTTGYPKGAILTHGMAFYNAVNYGIPNRISSSTVSLCVVPLFHTGALNNIANATFHQGGTVVVAQKFDPGEMLRVISDPATGVNNFMAVPAMFQALSQHPEFNSADFSRIVNAGVGGAPVPVSMHKLWRGRGVALQEGYGLTEGGPAVLISEIGQALEKAGSTGRPVLHCDIRLVDRDGHDVKTGDLGEIWIRGPAVTPGYWNQSDATASAFTEGWFRTGDVAKRDEDGYYYIVDRLKDMYISGGENVYPTEIENILYELPEIAEVAVIGIADNKWGEVGCAAIVLKPGCELSSEDVIKHCKHKLAPFKVPKRITYLDALPRNAVNKVLKNDLRNQMKAAALINT